MAIKKMIKGAQDLHTHSGRVDQVFLPHKAFMRITSLEMERSRRLMERASAMARVMAIDARFKEIDEEKNILLKALGERLDGNTSQKPAAAQFLSNGEKEGNKGDKGFKIKY